MKHGILFVDDEPLVLQGLKRRFRPKRSEWDMYFVENGADALKILEFIPIEIVVTDMWMPRMDGAALLEKVRKNYPGAVRMILSGHLDEDMIGRSVQSCHQFFSKPCNVDQLRNSIDRTCRNRDRFLKDEWMKDVIGGLQQLPSLPSLYFKLVKEMQSEQGSHKRVAHIIEQDPAMTAKIMQIVNSSFFGVKREIKDINHAVMFLGFEKLKALVLSIHIFGAFEMANRIPPKTMQSLWQHSLKVGKLAHYIAQHEGADKKMAEEAMIAGMLHDIGKLVVILAQLAKRKEKAEQYSDEGHAELGAYLLGLWGFSDEVIDAVGYHHHPSELGRTSFSPLTAVHVADVLVSQREGWPPHELDQQHLDDLGSLPIQKFLRASSVHK